MMLDYLGRLFTLAKNNGIHPQTALDTLERKVEEYISRDEKLGKHVHYIRPEKQYERAINVLERYYQRQSVTNDKEKNK